MPVDTLLNIVTESDYGLNLVTEKGEILRKAPLYSEGYESHFATCPQAKEHRKK